MRNSLTLIFLILFQTQSFAQVLVFAKANRKIQPMTVEIMTFIAETLHSGKTALNLNCEVKIREIKQERKFSDGIKIVEMLEINYHGGAFNGTEQKAYFPLNSVVTRFETNSSFSGVVEEMQLESDDLTNSRFTFQHNGRGEITWMSFEDDLKTLPCRLK